MRRLDQKPYGAYKDLLDNEFHLGATASTDRLPPLKLEVVFVQSDPFAAPSRLRTRIPLRDLGYPEDWTANPVRVVALCDFLQRGFVHALKDEGADRKAGGGGWGGAKGGHMRMEEPGQHVLARTGVQLIDGHIEARFQLGLPATGRTIQGQWCCSLLTQVVPAVLRQAFALSSLDSGAVQRHVCSVEAQATLRDLLDARGLVAFVRNGAVLPRRSGQSDLPLLGPADQQSQSQAQSQSQSQAQSTPLRRFESPPSMLVAFDLPHVGRVEGMGIAKGVTLIVGGGFHGKSTLLAALEVGVYNHIPGDGREFVCVSESAVKIRAEDGRSVTELDISPFINNLPHARSTTSFSTTCASGSTSQSANIVEMLEMGSRCLLLDEDTCATNFMFRDAEMGRIVHADKEPITPFLHRVRELWAAHGVSTVMVVGGCGSFFAVADTVVMMDEFAAKDVTARAKAIAAESAAAAAAVGASSGAGAGAGAGAGTSAGVFARNFSSARRVLAGSLALHDGDQLRVKDLGKIQIGRESHDADGNTRVLDLTGLEQLCELGQTRAIAEALQTLPRLWGRDSAVELQAELSALVARASVVGKAAPEGGLDTLTHGRNKGQGDLSQVRRFELAAAINRWRSLQTVSAAPAAASSGARSGAAAGSDSAW